MFGGYGNIQPLIRNNKNYYVRKVYSKREIHQTIKKRTYKVFIKVNFPLKKFPNTNSTELSEA